MIWLINNFQYRTTLTIFCLLLGINAYAQYPPVYVDAGGQVGRGIAVSRGADCYVIAPKHVTQDPVKFRIIGTQGRESGAERISSSPNWDLGALKLVNPSAVCSPDYYLAVTDFSEYLKVGQNAVLRVPHVDGTVTELIVGISTWDNDYITINTGGTNAILQEGLSGSMLYVAGQLAGMLITVDTTTGISGTAMRVERMNALTQSFAPLFAPLQEQARYDDRVAAEVLNKNMNYLDTQEFCQKIYPAARWLAERKPVLTHVGKYNSSGNVHYYIPSIIIPGQNSELWFRGPADKEAHIDTIIGRVPDTINIRDAKNRVVGALNKCLFNADWGPINNLRYRSRKQWPSGMEWDLDYTNSWGMTMEILTIKVSVAGDIQLRMWGDRD